MEVIGLLDIIFFPLWLFWWVCMKIAIGIIGIFAKRAERRSRAWQNRIAQNR